MVDQIGEFLKETQSKTNISLPEALIEILKTAPEQDNVPHELVEWIKQVKIEGRHSPYDHDILLSVDNLTKTIAIRNYYSPIQWQKANERASLELSNCSVGGKINRKLQKLTN